MIKNVMLLGLLLSSATNYCADKKDSKDKSSDMMKVKNWVQVIPFVDAIVVYRATTQSITRGKLGYIIDKADPTLRAGFVKGGFARSDEGEGYELLCLINKGSVNSVCTLRDSALEKNDGNYIEMRKATKAEITVVKSALDAHKAEFDYQYSIAENLDNIFATKS